MNPIRMAQNIPIAPLLFTAALLSGCATTPAPSAVTRDEALARHATAGHRAFESDATEQAFDQYKTALTRAEALDDAAAIAAMAFNAAVCAFELDRMDAAEELLVRASQSSQASGKDTAEILLLRVRVMLQKGRIEDALKLWSELDRLPVKKTHAAHKKVLAVELALAQKKMDAARAGLKEAESFMARSPHPLRARYFEAKAQLEGAKKETAAAAIPAWLDASGEWSLAGRATHVARTLALAAGHRLTAAYHGPPYGDQADKGGVGDGGIGAFPGRSAGDAVDVHLVPRLRKSHRDPGRIPCHAGAMGELGSQYHCTDYFPPQVARHHRFGVDPAAGGADGPRHGIGFLRLSSAPVRDVPPRGPTPLWHYAD